MSMDIRRVKLFFIWVVQPFETRIACFHARHISWSSCTLVAPSTKTWVPLSPQESCSEETTKSQDAFSAANGQKEQGYGSRQIRDLDCDIFKITQSYVSFLCYQRPDKSCLFMDETFVHRGEVILLQDLAELDSGKGLFEGLVIDSIEGNDFTIETKNRAQFMQVILNVDPRKNSQISRRRSLAECVARGLFRKKEV